MFDEGLIFELLAYPFSAGKLSTGEGLHGIPEFNCEYNNLSVTKSSIFQAFFID